MANFTALSEGFATLDTTNTWRVTGTAAVASSALTFPPNATVWTNYIATRAAWTIGDDTQPAGVVEFAPRTNGNAGWCISNNAFTNQPQGILIEQTSTGYRSAIIDGNTATNEQTFSTTDRYWRCVRDSGNIYSVYTQSSADGLTGWTFRGTHQMNPSTLGFTWKTIGSNLPDFIMYFRMVGGTGTTPVAAVRGINEVAKTSVTVPTAATSSSAAPVPVVQQRTVVTSVVATASVAAPAPSVKVKVVVDTAATAATVLPPPELNLPVPVSLSPPPAAVFSQAFVPEVIAPQPTTIPAPASTASSSAPAPVVNLLGNTTLTVPVSRSSVLLLPPGEYVRVTTPPAVSSARLPAALRVGPALSRFAATVVQTPQNWGGARVFYRLNDIGVALTDTLGLNHGGWGGTHALVDGGVANDPDKATAFNGTDTAAYNGAMPNYAPVTRTDVGFIDGGVTKFRRNENPPMWGYSAMVVFRTVPGATKNMTVFARADDGVAQENLSLSINAGRLMARFYNGNDWVDLLSGPTVNDGNWHMAVMTCGYPMDDDLGRRNPARFYLDGALQGINPQFAGVPTRPLTIGGRGGRASFEGALDEFAEFDYTLSRWEVSELWNQLNNLTGPALRIETTPATVEATGVAPTIRKSPVRPLNEFQDDFSAPFIDLNKWRDATPNVRALDGAAVLPANGARLLTPDYFQTRDSTFTWRLDRLPLREGHLFVGLINQHDIVPDFIFGGINKGDALRPHRTIGFDIYRSTTNGRTKTTIVCQATGESIGYGSKTRLGNVVYVPDGGPQPTPHKYLRLDIDGGVHGGATWYTSADGITWDEQYDIHGGKVNISTTPSIGPDGKAILDTTGAVVMETTTEYEDAGSFYLFDPGIGPSDVWPGGIIDVWQGHMRVLVKADGGNAATNWVIDNVNVPPQGTGTSVDILAKPARVSTSNTTEYLLFALSPRVYNSAQDISIEAPTIRLSTRFPTPPEPVYVFTGAITATVALAAPQRAGDALPVAVLAVPGRAQSQPLLPAHVGEATNYVAEPNQATATFAGIAPVEVNTDQSSPAPVGRRNRRVITLKTRNVRVLVTQN